jgi:outer membrane lipoprotein-sorting protein
VLVKALFLVAACGGSGLKTVDFTNLPVRTTTLQELVSQLNRDGESIATLKGKLGMGLQKGPDEEVRRCSGMLLADNSSARGLYLKGYKRLIPTFFTLVSDGTEFWFHIPRDDVVYTGPMDSSWSEDDSVELYLNTRDLFRALFVGPLEVDAVFEVQAVDTVYELSVYSGDIVARKLWIERKRFTVVRELYYDVNGIEQLEIQRREYVDLGGRLYPASLVLRDLISGSAVFLDFKSITVNPEDVPESAFQFRMPEGVRVKQVARNQTEA